MSGPLRHFLALLALVLLGAGGTAHGLTVGVLAPEGTRSAGQAWESTQAHLVAALPDQRIDLLYFDIPGLRAAVARGEVDFVLANSGLYVELEAAFGASRIATLESAQAPSPTEAIASTVLVRADRTDLRTLADLRGRRVAAAGRDAFGGWQVALREFSRAGLDADRDLTAVFTGFPMQAIVARVAAGEVDAGVVRNCVFEGMATRGEVAPDALRVLGERTAAGERCARSSALYPDWPFATLKHTPPELARRVAVALLAMPVDAEGTRWTVPTDYQRVHDLFRELKIGPYESLRRETLDDFVQRWRWAFALGFVMLLGGAVHIARAEWLVRKRTRALRAALEERERLARETREQQEKLDHLARLGTLGEISSMLAHELAQPLAAIGNFALGITGRVQSGRLDPDSIEAAAAGISEEAERAAGIMARIRDFSRKRPAERAPLDLAAVIDGAVRLFAAVVTDPPAVEVVVTARRPVRVLADRLQLEQVLLNLLKNAWDATRAPAAERPRIRVQCADLDGAVAVRVEDNGAGIDEAQRHRMFEPFYTTKPGGVGLGLALATRVVEAHGGRMWTEAVAPHGLAVCFTIPRMAEDRDGD